MISGLATGRDELDWIPVPELPKSFEAERLARLAKFQRFGVPLTGLSMGLIAGTLALLQWPGNDGWRLESREELFLAVAGIVTVIGYALSWYLLRVVSAAESLKIRRLAFTPLDIVLETYEGKQLRGRRDNLRVLEASDGGWPWVYVPTGSGSVGFRVPPELSRRLTGEAASRS